MRHETTSLPSLLYLRTQFLGLSGRAHPLFVTANSSPYNTTKAQINAIILSGSFQSQSLIRHWSDNKEGYCLAPTCHQIKEDVAHLIDQCMYLEPIRQKHFGIWIEKTANNPYLTDLIHSVLTDEPAERIHFIIDPSTDYRVIEIVHKFGRFNLDEIFNLTRSLIFSLYKTRSNMLTNN